MSEIKIFTAPELFPRYPVYRLIEWYYRLGFIPQEAKHAFLFWGNRTLRLLTVGLWRLFIEETFKQAAHRLDLEEAACRFMKENQAAISPPVDFIHMKSDTQTFNHVNDYVIKDRLIWFRRRVGVFPEGQKAGIWEKLYFDGELKGRHPVSISADGANLCVIDDQGGIHYRKVLLEGRGYKEIHKSQDDNVPIVLYMNDEDLEPNDTDTYVVVDITRQQVWQQRWYNFPVLSTMVNAVYRDVSVNGQTAISHRGRYNDGYLDAVGRVQPTSVGVTTLFELSKQTQTIFKYDPWAPVWSKVKFYFPENENQAFFPTRLDASGSHLMAVGYKVNKINGEGRLALLKALCDIDIVGGNPCLTYAYQTEYCAGRNAPKTRVLPDIVEDEGWEEVSLPEDAQVLFNQITVSHARFDSYTLRIAGKRADGLMGYFEKKNKVGSWCFVSDYALHEGSEPLLPEKQFEPIVQMDEYSPKHYSATLFNSQAVDVEHFGKRAYHSKVHMELGGNVYALGLHRRSGLRTFLGMENTQDYELVVPAASADTTILRFFKGKRVMPVKVTEREGSLHILPRERL